MASQRQLKTRYGRFSDDGREYIITTPRTPRPWINVISNGDYGFTISQTGGGYSWRTHAQMNRLTRWEQDVIKDEWGKYLYVLDADSGEVWSAGWKPVCAEPEAYEVRHGMGYTIITSRNRGIETEWLFLAAPDAPLELWKVTLRNRGRKRRSLRLFTYFEWGLGAAPDWHREFHKCFVETSFDAAHNGIFAVKRLWEVPAEHGHWNTNWAFTAFHSAGVKAAGFDCSKESFLGTYGSAAMPEAVRRGRLAKQSGNNLDPVASLQVNVTLAPGAEKSVCFTLGAAADAKEARSLMKRYRTPAAVDEALEQVRERWERLLTTTTVETPDTAMNLMLSRWLKYQAVSGRLWGRTAYYQTGGAYGFRDQLQDSQVFLPIDPDQTRKQILLHARHQFKDGTVYHWWHPITEIGHPTLMTDDLLWLPFLVSAYVQETGDCSILESAEPYLDDPAGGSIEDHCVRAIEKVFQRMSPRGIPLIGAGDWNDGLSAVGLEMKGESVWLGHFFHRILVDFAELDRLCGRHERAARYGECAAALRASINREGWDGEWYYYGTKDSGEKFGSRENKEGRIHLNAQTWAVLADVADDARANQVMDVVRDKLEFKAGPVLLAPAYKTPDPLIGYLTRYAPGTRENGAVYTHAATWAVAAMAKLKRAEDAYRIFSKLNPIVRGLTPDEYCGEPYVTPGNIDGPDSRNYGRGGWTWYSGSAAWLYRVGFDWVLGIRASFEGLIVDPCIPDFWPGFKATRLFRGAVYEIEVVNRGNRKRVLVDGIPIDCESGDGTIVLPVFPAGSRHAITVELA